MRWKAVHLHFDWDIEVPVLVGPKRFCVDAMYVPKTSIREFVHSLSPTYIEKHRMLKSTGGNCSLDLRRRHLYMGGAEGGAWEA